MAGVPPIGGGKAPYPAIIGIMTKGDPVADFTSLTPAEQAI
jgi:hypothetical protein